MTSLPRIQHVSIPRPPGSEEETRAFYGELLGLEEMPVPGSIRAFNLIWYQVGELELHLFSEEPVDDPSERHFCLQVDNLEALRERLVDAGYSPWEAPPIPGRPRFFCRDPFGNIIEFLKIEADYRAADE